jgi:hypothetical protein
VDLGDSGRERVRGKNCGERQRKIREEETAEARCGAGRTRSQTQEKGLAKENSVAVMLTDALCSLCDRLRIGLTLLGWKKWEGGGRNFDVTRKMYGGIEKGTKTVGIRANLRARTE